MHYLIGALISLVITDGLMTQILVGGGFAKEGNPLMEPLVGDNFFLVMKVTGALVSAFILWSIYKACPRLALISTACIVACYVAIVIWNLSVVFISA